MVILIVMGVSGCGKTTVAEELARKLQCPLKDGDSFHSEENKQKMRDGHPLTDEDRKPWLLSIHHYIKSLTSINVTGIVTCSALKRSYRNILMSGDSHRPLSENVIFVYLKGSIDLIEFRLRGRKDHFMPASLLQSQFEILEEPDDSEKHITVNIAETLEVITKDILNGIRT